MADGMHPTDRKRFESLAAATGRAKRAKLTTAAECAVKFLGEKESDPSNCLLWETGGLRQRAAGYLAEMAKAKLPACRDLAADAIWDAVLLCGEPILNRCLEILRG